MTYFIFIAVYLAILIGLGIYKAGKIKNQTDFAVAGRSLTPWILVGTMLATWIGTGSILGNAGKTYETGLASLILPLGGVLGIILLTRVAGKVRAFKKFTVPEIIGERYGQVARVLSVIALVMAYMVIVSYQYNAGGAVLETVLTDSSGQPMFSTTMATMIAAFFIILYTMLAGLVSVAYTDVANGIIMTLALIIAFPILWTKAGGIEGMEAAFGAMDKPQNMKFFGVFTTMDVINFCLPSFLLVLGDANMYQRFSASSTVKGATKATTGLIGAVLLVECLIIANARMSSSLIPDAENGRHVLIYAARHLLPTVLGGMMMVTIIGIIISTADSFLLVPATTLMRDVYQQYIDPNANDKKVVLVSRLLVLLLGLLAYWVSTIFAASETFFTKALYAYTIYGAAITPSLLAAFFWKGATKQGAIASIIAGVLVTLAWKELPFVQQLIEGTLFQSMDEVVPAISVSVICLIVFSLMSKKK